MQNEAGEFVDMYIPRKCSACNKIVAAKDHGSMQVNVPLLDETTGRMTGKNITYTMCKNCRRRGESNDGLMRLGKRDDIISKRKT